MRFLKASSAGFSTGRPSSRGSSFRRASSMCFSSTCCLQQVRSVQIREDVDAAAHSHVSQTGAQDISTIDTDMVTPKLIVLRGHPWPKRAPSLAQQAVLHVCGNVIVSICRCTCWLAQENISRQLQVTCDFCTMTASSTSNATSLTVIMLTLHSRCKRQSNDGCGQVYGQYLKESAS